MIPWKMRRGSNSKDPLIVCINGPMCTGKSTLAKAVNGYLLDLNFRVKCVYVGSILRNLMDKPTVAGRRIRYFLDHNVSIPSAMVSIIIEENLNDKDTDIFILEGVPRNDEQVIGFDFLENENTLMINLAGIGLRDVLERIRGRKICSECSGPYENSSCVHCGCLNFVYRPIDLARWNREDSANRSETFQLYLSRKHSQGTALVMDVGSLDREGVRIRCLEWLSGYFLDKRNED